MAVVAVAIILFGAISFVWLIVWFVHPPSRSPIEAIATTPEGVKIYRVCDDGNRAYFAVDKDGHVAPSMEKK